MAVTGCGLQHGQDVQCRNTLGPTERAISVKISTRAWLHMGIFAPSTRELRSDLNCMMPNEMDGYTPEALQPAVDNLLGSRILLHC